MHAASTGHHLTTTTALEILKAGGNAFDAALAAYMVSFVAEPCMGGAGGGAHALVRTSNGVTKLFDFFCQTPQQKREISTLDFYPVEVNFGGTSEVFHIGKGSTAVPGAIAGIFAIHEQLGSLPMRELVQPAMEAAREGVVVNDFQFYDFQLLEPMLAADKKAKDIFFPQGHLVKKSELMRMPRFADFLDYLWREGKNAFYRGEVAEKVAIDHLNGGGHLTLKDFADYQVVIRDPHVFRYGNHQVLTNPFPATGGVILSLCLAGLPAYFKEDDLLSSQVAKQRYKALRPVYRLSHEPTKLHAALEVLGADPPDHFQLLYQANRKWGSTSHLNVVDKEGNAISLSMTLGEGCGYFIENTDIQLNNMLGEGALMPNGFHSWIPNTRLSSMMSPTIVLDENKNVKLVLGSGGASRIPAILAQVIQNYLVYGLDIRKAIRFPRLHAEHDQLHLEPGFQDPELITALGGDKVILWEEHNLFFGGVHAIAREKEAYIAIGDDRRDGVGMTC